MRNVTLDSGSIRFAGALDFDRSDAGLTPRRLPDWTRPQLPALMEVMVTMPSGVRLELSTTSRALELDVLLTSLEIPGREVAGASFDLIANGERVDTQTAKGGNRIVIDLANLANFELVEGEPSTLRFDGLPAGPKECELWLPSNARVDLRALRVDDDAAVEAPTVRPRRRWVHHGSSISHCVEVRHPTHTWPAVAARLADVELLNLGLGGNCHLDPFVARTMRDEPADAISLKAGINILNMDSLKERTFTPLLHGFLDTLREGKPDTPVLLVSPIICPSAEDHPGPTIPDANGKFITVGGPEARRRNSLTLRRMREIMADLVERRRTAGDPNLHYLDGLALFGPDDVSDLPDGLHPNEAGYVRMGQRFHELAFGPGAPLAHR